MNKILGVVPESEKGRAACLYMYVGRAEEFYVRI